MGALDHLDLPSEPAKPKQKFDMVPETVARKVRKKDRKQRLQDAYDEVDERDGMVCWVTGKQLYRSTSNQDELLTHHHLAGRNVKPEWKYLPERIISVSWTAHGLITPGIIEVEGDDARKSIRFHYREGTPMSSRVVKIQSRRRSQR